MGKLERLEELKRKMMSDIYNREPIPQEVLSVVQQAFMNLQEKYEELRCDSSSIREYIDWNLKTTKSYIKRELAENRINNQSEQIEQILNKMQRSLDKIEEQKEQQEEQQEEIKYKQEISEMEPEDRKTTDRIIQVIEDSLLDVQSRQNKLLYSREYRDDKIEEIQYETRKFIRKFLDSNGENIYGVLRADNRDLANKLIEDYEEYLIENNRQQEEKSDEEKSKREKFLEENNANISLDEQRDFSGKMVDNMKREMEENEYVESLPDNIIE